MRVGPSKVNEMKASVLLDLATTTFTQIVGFMMLLLITSRSFAKLTNGREIAAPPSSGIRRG